MPWGSPTVSIRFRKGEALGFHPRRKLRFGSLRHLRAGMLWPQPERDGFVAHQPKGG